LEIGRIRLLAVDVAGTLTDDRRLIYPEVIYALRKLEKAEIPVSIVTGNSFMAAYKIAQYFGLSGPIIAESGAVVYDPVLKKRILVGDPELGRKAVNLIVKELGLTPSFLNRYRDVDFIFEKNGDIGAERIRKICKEHNLEIRVSDSKFLIHVCDKKVNKGTGLIEACKLRGIPLSQVAAIGDSWIDLEMLKVVGLPIAVFNSPEELKQVAKIVTKKPDGEGVIEVIEEYLLGEITS